MTGNFLMFKEWKLYGSKKATIAVGVIVLIAVFHALGNPLSDATLDAVLWITGIAVGGQAGVDIIKAKGGE